MDVLDKIVDEITLVISKVKREELYDVVSIIKKDSKIFVDGQGRSGLIAKSFAMRLMHLGYEVYVVGETITPSIQKGNIYFSISGSGESECVVLNTKKAKEKGCTIVSVTSKPQSTIGILSDKIIIVPGDTKNDVGEARNSVQLLSSLFDQSLHIVLDALCLIISKENNISNKEATERHW